jgi:Domain of unknown function (DUF4185)
MWYEEVVRRAPALAAVILAALVPVTLRAEAQRASGRPAVATPGQAHALRVVSVTDLGTLRHPDAATGDGGISGIVGERILWVFGDTFLGSPAADGTYLRTNTAGWADRRTPFLLRQSVETRTGAPLQLIPFDGDEIAFNRDNGRRGERIALWPMSVVDAGDGRGYVDYLKLVVLPGVLDYRLLGVGIARVRAGRPSAERLPGLLFGSGAPQFGTAAFVDRGTLYSYACRPISLSAVCGVARVPMRRITERSAYRFWDGGEWSADIATASEGIPGSTTGYSVAWNEHLHAYLAVYSTPLANRIMARTAPAPQGPWSGETLLLTGEGAPAGSYDYFGIQHAELAAHGGREIIVTYSHLLDPLHAEIRVVAVRLA